MKVYLILLETLHFVFFFLPSSGSKTPESVHLAPLVIAMVSVKVK